MPKSLRLFIAIEIPHTIRQSLSDLISEVRAGSDSHIKWVKPENIHLTLKFLGDTPQEKVPLIVKGIENVAVSLTQFSLKAQGTGVFPSTKQPRVLWAGVTALPEMERLYHLIDEKLIPLGFLGEKRGFSPHLTLGRVAETADSNVIQTVVKRLLQSQQKEFGSADIDHVTLFQSTLAQGGSIYTPLMRIDLQKLDANMLESTKQNE